MFASLTFPPGAFPDSGQSVTVEIRPRPGVYGLDLSCSLPLRSATLMFSYPRFFSAPSRARQVYRSDAAYERALAIGRILPDNQTELLASSRPAADHLSALITAAGSYLVGAPE